MVDGDKLIQKLLNDEIPAMSLKVVLKITTQLSKYIFGLLYACLLYENILFYFYFNTTDRQIF